MNQDYRNDADYQILDIVNDMGYDSSDFADYNEEAAIIRNGGMGSDYKQIVNDSDMMSGAGLDHPLGNMIQGGTMRGQMGRGQMGASLWEIATGAASDLVSQGEQAARQAAGQAVGNVAQNLLQRPEVSTALTTQAQQAAVTATAGQIQATATKVKNFWATNQKKILIGGGVLIAALIGYKYFMKRK